jgi:hypothetical protein
VDAIQYLESLRDFVRQSPRNDWNPEGTQLILELEFAWGLKRLGEDAVAAQVSRSPLSTLATQRPTERFIASMFRWRISNPTMQEWPTDVVAEYRGLDFFDQYTAMRTINSLSSLEARRTLTPAAQSAAWSPANTFGAWPQPFEWQVQSQLAPISESELIERITNSREIGRNAREGWPIGEYRVVREAFRAAAPSGLAAITRASELVRERWPTAKDTFSTSKQFWSLAHLQLLDAVIFATVEAVAPALTLQPSR